MLKKRLVLKRLWMGFGLILLLLFSGVVNFGSLPALADGPEQPVENVSLAEENNNVLLDEAATRRKIKANSCMLL